jgi:large subunit ribosomal protein L4e
LLAMATARPVVSVYNFETPSEKKGTLTMPAVLASPLRPDLVRYIHKNVSKNKRQPIAVGGKVGYETAGESWGTGRAVARVPRAPGGGTHRSGQGVFGNMCRGGGMFNPTKTWRRWQRKVNVTEKRHAVATSLAASSLPPLVMARGHRIGGVAELPLVISDGVEAIEKTKQALATLKELGCGEELKRLQDSKKIRVGKGKARNRRYTIRRGPLVVYNEDNGIVKAMRNIPGVETACVARLNLLKLAPGGQFGRFVIWTEGAFQKLNELYGTLKSGSPMKKGYTLPRAPMQNADIARIINSSEVQSVLRAKLEAPKKFEPKINALKNKAVMKRLNPLDKKAPSKDEVQKAKKARKQASKEHNKKSKRGDDTFYKVLMRAFETKAKKEDEEVEEE